MDQQSGLHRAIAALWQDVRYGWRSTRATAPVSIAVVLTLVIGLGLNSVLLSLFNGLLFRPLVSRNPDTFVQIYAQVSGDSDRTSQGPGTLVTLEDFDVIRSRTETMTAVTVSRWASFTLGDPAVASLRGKLVSCNYLSAHVGPLTLGRGFAETDCSSPGAQPVLVLTQRGWETYFERDPSIVGRAVRLNDQWLTVVGVAPDDAVGDPVASMLYVPFTMQPALQGPGDYFRESPGRHAWLNLSGRLRPGRSLSDAQAELNVIAGSLDRLHPGQKTGMLVTDGAIIHEPGTARDMPMLLALCFAIAGLILLMVCANVTTLLLARAGARRHEMLTRVALGASRVRLVRQLLTETVVLAGCAGAASIGLAYYLPARLAQMLTDFPLLDAFEPDWRVFGLTLGLALLAGGVAGLSPAFESCRVDLASALKPAGDGGRGYAGAGLRRMLITYQLSVTLALLIGIGLMIRAQHRLVTVRLDYDAPATLLTHIDLSRAGYTGPAARAFYDQLLPALESLPGVRDVALTSPAPFRGSPRLAFRHHDGAGASLVSSYRSVSPEYFAIAGIRLLRGRLFGEAESRAPQRVMPIVVSESFARAFFPQSPAVGERIRFGNDDAAVILGVVSDTSSVRPTQRDEPMIYQPVHTATLASITPMIRFEGDSRPLVQAIRRQVQTIDPRLSAAPETVAAAIARDANAYTTVMSVTAIPAGLALFLSVVGLYGLTAFVAVQRTHEIGVRMVLGATRRDVLVLLLESLRRPFVMGVIGGSVLAAIGATVLNRTSLTVDVSAGDPLIYAGSILLLTATAAAATLVPALRAARHQPWHVLRNH